MVSNKIWNTGVNENGKQLVPNNLNPPVDPHWLVIQGPGITNPQNVYVLTDQKAGNYFGTPDSRWVWADASGKGDTSAVYVFQTRFYVEVDLSQHWIQINGKWSADNFGQFTIDKNPLPPGSGDGAIFLPAGNIVSNYQQPHDFSISQAHFLSLSRLRLNVGWHTLEVWVHNEGALGDDDPMVNPAGFNLSAMSIEIHPVRKIPVLHPPGS
ncbi:hypothetical protein AYJ54_02900 [Bradyrhizobium centrolobii]|uniref:Uncharacterized protein n=1 Tax=Bradyrhizobium centrolobii TaxID=1505087 RepID=A0A176YJJ8_9BRAD|nr:hypothetical protein [Bradyrhizobium centrolobii]OAF05846.1 hypothetical protein AYJ54_02900 [Bradyrhizobium centrolobii]